MTKTATKKSAAKKTTKKTPAAKAAKKPAARKATKKSTVKKTKAADEVVEIDRRAAGGDRRGPNSAVAVKTEKRKVTRRRQIDPTTCERDYSGDEIEFMQAMDAYKRSSGRMFPTCSEILEVVRSLGYCRPGEEVAVAAGGADGTNIDATDFDSEESLDDAGVDSEFGDA